MKLAGVLLFLFVGGAILLAGMTILVSTIFLIELRLLAKQRRRPDARSAFGDKLLRDLTRGTIREIADVYDAYRSFLGIEVLRSSHLEDIREFLQAAISQSAGMHPQAVGAEVHADIQLAQELLAANERALEVEMHCAPFSGTPEPERHLLEDLVNLTAGDDRPAMMKLGLLAKAIRTRLDALDGAEREGARTMTLARWGWIGTICFSLLAIILGLLIIGG